MNIKDYISEKGNYIANNYLEVLLKKNPKELDEMTNLINNMTEIAIHLLRESPEFRRQFARIHSEFLKYPESREVIEDSIKAFSKYNQMEEQSIINRH